MDLRFVRIQLESSFDGLPCPGAVLFSRAGSRDIPVPSVDHPVQARVSGRESGVRRGELRIELEGSLQHTDRDQLVPGVLEKSQ